MISFIIGCIFPMICEHHVVEPIITGNDSHLAMSPSRCHICFRMLSGRHSLQRHMRIHSKSRPYNCPHCLRDFRHRTASVRHLPCYGDTLSCPICSKKYLFRPSLLEHMRINHRNSTRHTCPHNCSYTTPRISDLRKHIQRRHTELRLQSTPKNSQKRLWKPEMRRVSRDNASHGH
ncbi:hypothetical protein AAMO2058_000447300 [Amorphochlora amoebiformis]